MPHKRQQLKRGGVIRGDSSFRAGPLVDTNQVTTVDLAVTITANLNNEGGDRNNGNEQDGEKNEHEMPFEEMEWPGTEATLLVYDPLSTAPPIVQHNRFMLH